MGGDDESLKLRPKNFWPVNCHLYPSPLFINTFGDLSLPENCTKGAANRSFDGKRQADLHSTKVKKMISDRLLPEMEFRNRLWERSDYIPDWVNIKNVGLDQFFTKSDIAEYCWESLCKYIEAHSKKLADYTFIEPSAGHCAFYKLLPKDRRIGIDVVRYPEYPDIIKQDFLSWQPKDRKAKYVCIGNPPFGYRAWLALVFLNHASLFSDYVGFIMPMAFQSEGKSNPKDRVKGLHLVHSELLPPDSFITADGKTAKVNSLWQIWARESDGTQLPAKTCNQYIDLFTVDMRKERLCGKKRLDEADFFLQRTFYTEPPKLVKTFDKVRYVCGYGIVIRQDRKKVLKILRNTDWKHYSNLASHNCRHISMGHIRNALIDAGLVDTSR